MSDHDNENDSQYSQNDMGDFKNMHVNIVQTTGVIRIPPITGRTVFHITVLQLQLLQLRGMFGRFNS